MFHGVNTMMVNQQAMRDLKELLITTFPDEIRQVIFEFTNPT